MLTRWKWDNNCKKKRERVIQRRQEKKEKKGPMENKCEMTVIVQLYWYLH